jgi:nucleotide-binding universal stress UspA family protein
MDSSSNSSSGTVSKISSILVAVDGSDNAFRAFDSALRRAKQLGSKIYVIAVIQVPAASTYGRELSAEFEKIAQNEANKMLSDYAKEAKEKHGIKVETILAKGNPSIVIIQKAKENDADMIVMGSRGLGGVKELFLGSVSHSVARNAKVPVLVVK